MSTYESIGPSSDDDDDTDIFNQNSIAKQRSQKSERKRFSIVKDYLFSRHFIKALILGQCLSVLLCGTGVFSGLLQNEGVNIPTAQSFLLYCILCLVFTTQLAYKQGERNFASILRYDGWKYAILGLIDVEANYLVIKAYKFTTVTSVQVLDCFSIAAVVFLSRFVLHTHYKWKHYIGISVSLLGLGGLITSDVVSGKNGSDGGSNVALGDLLIVCGALLYGVSNVGQEFVVKTYNKSEFLGMIGLFSSLFSGLQLIVLESGDLDKVDFTSYKIFLPWLGLTVFLFLIYTCMSYVIQETSATVTNISILSADFYSLIVGIFIFHYTFHILYLISFSVVLAGITIYSLQPTSAEAVSTLRGVQQKR